MKALLRSVVLIMMLVVALAVGVSAAEVVLYPIEDSYVKDGGDAATNFGASEQLQLKYESEREGFTRSFSLSLTSAKLNQLKKRP